MTYPEGHPGHCALCMRRAVALAVEAFNALTPEEQATARREQAIDFALGNLNASTNHRTTRDVVEAAYDRLHPESE